MWCLSNKAIKTDEDPPDKPKKNPSRAKTIVKKMKDKVIKWVKKPKKAAQNPITEPLYGRRNEMTLDLTQPLPFSNVINGLHSDLPKNLPTDPKKTIIFTTSSSKFMKIEEVRHQVPQKGIRIGSQRNTRQIGHGLALRPKMIEYNETDLNRLEKGKAIVQFSGESDSDLDHSGGTLIIGRAPGRQIARGNGLAFRAIEMDKQKETAMDRYVGKGKEIIVEFPDESDLDSDSIPDDSSPSNSVRAIQEGILIDEIPIEEFSCETTIEQVPFESGALIEEIPVEEFSLESIEEISFEAGTEIEEISEVTDASMRQLVPYRRIYLSFDILKFHISQILAGLPPCFAGPVIVWTELPYALQVTNSQKYDKGKAIVQFSFAGPSNSVRSIQDIPLLQDGTLVREKGKGIIQYESEEIEQSIRIEEIPIEEFSQEGIEAAIITHSKGPADRVQPISYRGPTVCRFDYFLGSTAFKNQLSQLVPSNVPPPLFGYITGQSEPHRALQDSNSQIPLSEEFHEPNSLSVHKHVQGNERAEQKSLSSTKLISFVSSPLFGAARPIRCRHISSHTRGRTEMKPKLLCSLLRFPSFLLV